MKELPDFSLSRGAPMIPFALRNRKIDLEGWFRAHCVRGVVRTLIEMVTLR